MKTAIIYSLSCPITKEIRYIGKSTNLDNRLRDHLSRSKRLITHKDKWINFLLSKNLKPVLEIIDIIEEENWKFWEQHYISLFKSWNFNLTNGTNGGDGGSFKKHTDISKLKMSLSRKGKKRKLFSEETKLKMSISAKKRGAPLNAIKISAQNNKGKKKPPLSDSTKEKIRQHRLNKKHTQETILKIKNNCKNNIQILCVNNEKTYNSISDACKELNINIPNVVEHLKGRRKSVGGYTFTKI